MAPTVVSSNIKHTGRTMNWEWSIDNDSYGLGFWWDSKLTGKNVHGNLGQHMLMVVFINMKLAIYWG